MNQIYTVSQVNSYIKGLFSRDMALSGIAIQGEISNCTYHSSGHIYFTLKDAEGRISCVMFAGNRRGLEFRMSDGMKVVVIGSINVYEKDGKYQLYASRIMREGYGELYEKLERLKKKLSDEGLFSDVYKKDIPYYSKNIGVVTAATGAAIQDIVNITSRRNPYVQLYLYPAVVQGDGAAESIARGIKELDARKLDVIIVGRGGGSFEDLFAFNEEIVVRAIYDCKTPVISAVGHEVDTTLSDYVADLRAPTPSAAAELAVTNLTEIYARINECRDNLTRQMLRIIEVNRSLLTRQSDRLKYLSPKQQLDNKRMQVADMEEIMNRIIQTKLDKNRNRLLICCEKLKVLSPLSRLSGGYSYVTNQAGQALVSVEQVETGDSVTVNLRDGKFEAVVKAIQSV